MQVLGAILFLGYGFLQIVVGFVGIEYHLGVIWAAIALGAAFVFRFILPLTVGSFFGAMDVLGWHWALAALFAVPGLLFIVPGVIVLVLDAVRGR